MAKEEVGGKGSISTAAESLAGDISGTIAKILKDNLNPDIIVSITQQIDKSTSELSKKMGISLESSNEFRRAMSDAYSDVRKLGGSFTDIVDTQKAVIDNLGRNLVLSTEYHDDIYRSSKLMNTTSDELIKKFTNVGTSLYNIDEQTNTILNTSREIGVSAEKVSSQVLENLGSMDQINFSNGIQGLSKMAATSSMLRVDMKEVLNAVDAAFDPEGAIKLAAGFQRLGATQTELLDPIRLMNMSRNDPEEFERSIAKMMAGYTRLDEKGNVVIANGNKAYIREMAKLTNLSVESLTNMGRSYQELQIKMDKIKFPDFATEEQKEFISNITSMKDGKIQMVYENKLTDINEVLGKVSSKEDLATLLESSKPKTNEELLVTQTSYQERMVNALESLAGKTGYAVGGSKQGTLIMQAESKLVTTLTNTVNNMFNISKMREGFDKNVGGLTETVLKITKGEGSFEDFKTSLSMGAESLKNFSTNAMSNLAELSTTLKKESVTSENPYTQLIDKLLIATGGVVGESQKIEMPKGILTPNMNLGQTQLSLKEQTNIEKIQQIKDITSKEHVTVETTNNHNGELTLKFKMENDGKQITPEQLLRLVEDPSVKESLIKLIQSVEPNNNTSKLGKK